MGTPGWDDLVRQMNGMWPREGPMRVSMNKIAAVNARTGLPETLRLPDGRMFGSEVAKELLPFRKMEVGSWHHHFRAGA